MLFNFITNQLMSGWEAGESISVSEWTESQGVRCQLQTAAVWTQFIVVSLC